MYLFKVIAKYGLQVQIKICELEIFQYNQQINL